MSQRALYGPFLPVFISRVLASDLDGKIKLRNPKNVRGFMCAVDFGNRRCSCTLPVFVSCHSLPLPVHSFQDQDSPKIILLFQTEAEASFARNWLQLSSSSTSDAFRFCAYHKVIAFSASVQARCCVELPSSELVFGEAPQSLFM